MTVYKPYGDTAYRYGNLNRLYGLGAETILSWGIEIDWNGDGIYNGASEAPYAVNFETDRGRQNYLNIDSDGNAMGFEPVRVGTATLTLDNTTRRYDPYNTSSPLYPYVLPNRFVRLRVLYNGTIYDVFHGKIKKITTIDNEAEQKVRLDLEDGLRLLQSSDASVAIQQDIDIDDAVQQVLTDIDWPSLFGTSLDDASDVLDYWWADDRAATEVRRLAEAELGQFFVSANGNATFKSRHDTSAAVLTLTSGDFLKEVDVPFPTEVIRNTIKIIAHPITLEATANLWTLGDVPLIAANGGSLTVWATYLFNDTPVPAINVLNPVITTDYLMNTAEDGSGTNRSASFSVVLTDFGKTGKLVITNNHASDAAYVTLLKVRGDALDSPNPSLLIEEDTASQAIYGKALLTLDNPWLQDTSLASDFANWLISYLPNPQKFLTVRLEGRPDIQFTADLFDMINATITKLGISAVNYNVAGISHKWLSDNGQAVRTEWILEPKPSNSNFWIFTTTLDVSSIFGI